METRAREDMDADQWAQLRWHVDYEFSMFRHCRYELEIRGKKKKSWDAPYNALLESFLLHWRVLAEFFFPEERNRDRHPDAVCADDFHQRGRSRKMPLYDGLDDDLRGQVNRRLAHLSCKRLEYSDDQWDFEAMGRHMDQHIVKFERVHPVQPGHSGQQGQFSSGKTGPLKSR